MFELGIFGVIALAAGYWATLWLMGRRDDVLHGKFVHPEAAAEGEASPEQARWAPAARRPFPERPPQRAGTDASTVNSAALQTLLAAIKQDLKDVA